MQNEAPSADASQDLRRGTDALHGPLHFSPERRYPEGITRSLQQLPNGRELTPSMREAAAQVRGRAPAGVAGEVVTCATASMEVP